MATGYRIGKLVSNKNLVDSIYELKVEINGLEKLGKPGQFYMVRSWQDSPFLSRPISIARMEDNILTFLYEVRGKGTSLLSKLKSGDSLQLLGPLGNGFKIDDINKNANIALVSGGIGIAPLIYLATSLKENRKGRIDFYCGFKDKAYYTNILKKYVDNLYISTESGRVGYKGLVVDLLKLEKYNLVYTCGPEAMMEYVVKKAIDLPVYVTMERQMACGIGACCGCTIEAKEGIKRVCKEGPVFLGKEVVF